jgi:uncharacterized membrane protein YfcA
MSGFFGIGGGMILIPILLVLGFDIKIAIGMSIIQMVFSSIYGSYLNHKKGLLPIGDGLFIGLGGFVGGFFGAYLTEYIPNTILQYLFIALLLFASFRLWFSKNNEGIEETKIYKKKLLFTIGLAIGIFSMALGIGGSIILTPLLVGILQYPLKKAISAGLFFVVFSSIAGFISRWQSGNIDFEHGLVIAIASLLGVALGIFAKEHINTKHHKIMLLLFYLFSLSLVIKEIL